MSIADNIAEVQAEINLLNKQYNLPEKVNIIAVTKNVEIELIEQAISSGITNFGENYVQEALSKWRVLISKYPHIKLHLIGGLQSNKVNKALSLFDTIATIDRFSIVDVLAKKPAAVNKKYYVEVNFVNNIKRSGVEPAEVKALTNYAKSKQLKIVGIMGIAPTGVDPVPYFKILKSLQIELQLPILSMGMTNDYKQAILCGATEIRLGSKIFGARK
ncbi:YggS family pyridoxal phosphate-dependent enzyme [Rickettsiales bacterium LUAb2]